METFLSKGLGLETKPENVTKLSSHLCKVRFRNIHDKMTAMRGSGHVRSNWKLRVVWMFWNETERQSVIDEMIANRVNVEKGQRNRAKAGHMMIWINGREWAWEDSRGRLIKVEVTQNS